MASPSAARLVEASPHYVRLPPGVSGYTVELSSDVLRRLTGEIAAASKLGIETGGLLLGSWELLPRLVVQIEEFELVAPRPEDGSVYLLSPRQQEQFAVARQRATDGGLAPVGFFRTHIRSGPLALSLADKGLLWSQFRSGNYLALLIEAREPRKASLFLSADGKLALHSLLPALPSGIEIPPPVTDRVPVPVIEASPDPVASPVVEQSPEAKQGRRIRPELLTFCAVLLFAIGIVLWPAWEATFGGPWAIASSADMALNLQRHGQNLDVTWNKKMPEIGRAQGATLTIVEGSHRTQLELGKDDLRFGSIVYVYKAGKVEADLAVKMQDATSLVQSAVWPRP